MLIEGCSEYHQLLDRDIGERDSQKLGNSGNGATLGVSFEAYRPLILSIWVCGRNPAPL